jgi:hypothetical protein
MHSVDGPVYVLTSYPGQSPGAATVHLIALPLYPKPSSMQAPIAFKSALFTNPLAKGMLQRQDFTQREPAEHE